MYYTEILTLISFYITIYYKLKMIDDNNEVFRTNLAGQSNYYWCICIVVSGDNSR